VTLRHVPHHLEEPARAIAEALRVAKTGLLVAEPWFDVSVPSQVNALAMDGWEKRQHRRSGMYHAEVIELGELLGLLPDPRALVVDVHCHLRLRTRHVATVEADAAKLIGELPEDHFERRVLEGHLASLRSKGLTWNGSQCLVVRKT
jgi:hypothetical protein